MKQFLPFLEWLPKYNRKLLRGDVMAGLTVAVMLVPQGMAYGLLAGLPPIYGLYAGIVPLLLYAFFGTSRQLSVGPTALVSLLVLSGLVQFAEPYSATFIALAIATALIAGTIQVILGIFRLGFLINFLSHPVISGFTSAAAIIIAFSQARNLLRIDLPRSNQIHEVVIGIAQHIHEAHWPTFFMGIGGIVSILLIKRLNKHLPNALITIIIGIVIVWLGKLNLHGIEIVGEVPSGLPAFEVPNLSWPLIKQLFPLALTICLISFIESLAIGKLIEAKHRNYRVIPNQELIALGLTKIGGAFFQSFPTTGSFTRSAINDDAGAHSGISSVVSAIMISVILLFFTPLFYYLPKAMLAAIIIVAVRGLIGYKEAIHLWKNDRRDFLTLMATFIATLTLGIQMGVVVGIVLSLAIMIYRNSVPHIAVLGRLPDTTRYRNINRFEEAIQDDEVLIVRFDAQLYFGNSEYFRETIEELVKKGAGKLKLLILDASSIHDIDSNGIHALKEVLIFLKNRQLTFYVAGFIGPVRDILYKQGLLYEIGHENQFLSVHDAMECYQNEEDKKGWSSGALQTNVKKNKPS